MWDKPQALNWLANLLFGLAVLLFLYAALLWPGVAKEYRRLTEREGQHANVAIVQASEKVLAQAMHHVMIPKRFSLPMREIWVLQPRFEARQGGRAKRLLTHPRFRAAYDFLLLRASVGEGLNDNEFSHWMASKFPASADSFSFACFSLAACWAAASPRCLSAARDRRW